MVEEHPSVINEYKVIKLLGQGTYAKSYLVNKSTNENLVLKLMLNGIDSSGVGRFENEVVALKKLKHPNIPKFIESGTYKNNPFIVMTLAKGVIISKMIEEANSVGNRVGYITVMGIIIQLFSILKYIHGKKLNHRDIKGDNVIYDQTTGKVFLIDFGFSKTEASPFKDQTFWNAGASRFSPPSKLESPSLDSPSHDVFAVGVLAYLLCTNDYPWSTSVHGDVGSLKALMNSRDPKPIGSINNLLPNDMSEFIHSLLIIDDIDRISSSKALNKAKHIRKGISEKAKISKRNEDLNILSRVIRCPIHGDIRFSEYEWRLINSKEFNRLRYLKQLGTTNLVYPGATHSRFSHAIGAVHCSTRILESLEKIGGYTFTTEDKSIVRIFSLMHDISHVAYGHTLEDELQIFKRHDENINRLDRLLYASTSNVGEKLRSTEEGRMVLNLLNPEEKIKEYKWASEIVTSPIGADVLDYIDRDSVYCGLEHRVDSAIYRHFKIQESRVKAKEHVISALYGKHGIRIDAEFAINSILYQRFALFLKVYTHPVKVSAGAMIGKALSLEFDGDDIRESNIEEKLEYMSDEELELFLLSSKKNSVSILAKMIRHRQIYEPVFKSSVITTSNPDLSNETVYIQDLKDIGVFNPKERLKIEEKISKAVKVKIHDIIIYCSPSAPGKKKFTQRVAIEKNSHLVRKDSYRWHMEMQKNHLGLWYIYGFVNPNLAQEKKDEIGRELNNILERPNQVDLPGRQRKLFD